MPLITLYFVNILLQHAPQHGHHEELLISTSTCITDFDLHRQPLICFYYPPLCQGGHLRTIVGQLRPEENIRVDPPVGSWPSLLRCPHELIGIEVKPAAGRDTERIDPVDPGIPNKGLDAGIGRIVEDDGFLVSISHIDEAVRVCLETI